MNIKQIFLQIRWLFLGLLPKYLKIKRPGEMSCKNKFVDVTKQYEEHDPVLIVILLVLFAKYLIIIGKQCSLLILKILQ